MERLRPHRLDFELGPIGLGTVKIGRNRGVKYPTAFELPDDAAVRALLETAQACGVRLIDTAPAYGVSEERLGRLLPGRREEWVLSTKAGEEFDGLRSSFDFSAEGIRRSVERSLARLRTEALDIVLLHLGDDDAATLEQAEPAEALVSLKASGYVRAIGASCKSVEAARLALEFSDVLMLTFHRGDERMRPIIREASARGIAVLVKKALQSGHATASGGEEGVRAALEFVFAEPGVTAAVVGTINPVHLRRNAEVAADMLRGGGSAP